MKGGKLIYIPGTQGAMLSNFGNSDRLHAGSNVNIIIIIIYYLLLFLFLFLSKKHQVNSSVN